MIQLFADGAETYLSTVPEGDLYMTRTMLPQELSDAPGGTAAALAQLANAALGDSDARAVVEDAKTAMLNSQHLIFDLLHSHMSGGGLVLFRSHPTDMKNHGFNEWQTCLSGRMARAPGSALNSSQASCVACSLCARIIIPRALILCLPCTVSWTRCQPATASGRRPIRIRSPLTAE